MKGGRRRRVRRRGKIKQEEVEERGGTCVWTSGVLQMGACQKGLGRRKVDGTANCEESCDSVEGDWL